MRGFGAALVLLGAGTFILPRVGVPLGIRFIPAEYQLHASIGCVVLGALLLALSFRGKKKEEKP